tara:strand:- start:118 stop:411 length:294 start_codon:yes stop_codon:yes gene_type:complete
VVIKSLTKFEIAKILSKEKGYSSSYSKKIVNDFFECIKQNIKLNNFKLKNIGTFKILNKKERIGRNPKTNEIFKIRARKSLSFNASKELTKNLNKNY